MIFLLILCWQEGDIQPREAGRGGEGGEQVFAPTEEGKGGRQRGENSGAYFEGT